MSAENLPHRRYNPLTGDWVLVSPQRTQRPWMGQVEEASRAQLPEYDPDCYLCPGNIRSGGDRNPSYSDTFVFDNDFPALISPDLKKSPSLTDPNYDQQTSTGKHLLEKTSRRGLLLKEAEYGVCRVVCFSPRHDLSLPELTTNQISAVVRTWIEQMLDLQKQEFLRYVQVFENKGAMMGASNPHPHCQIWATVHIPNEPAKEQTKFKEYASKNKGCLLCDYLQIENKAGERVVITNDDFTVLVPFWAIWPYEVMLLPNRHKASLTDLSPSEIEALADIMRRLTIRYDNLFNTSFPYSMGFHPTPINGGDHPEWHFHAHYYPPLLRSASVRKFMVGFEMLGSPQRDLTPEQAAERLRSVSEVRIQ
jgi:UDPglucose--hexose-1-phosphate uridylyltransferase